jgi:hypothetical protein
MSAYPLFEAEISDAEAQYSRDDVFSHRQMGRTYNSAK